MIFGVKRLLLIALLVLIPFQFAWAGMGVFCEHEAGTGAFHFGHHSHQHVGKKEASDAKSKVANADLDCGSCHGECAMIAALPAQGAIPLETKSSVRLALLYTSYIADGPRRPDRLPVT